MEKDIIPNYDINYLPLKVTGLRRKLDLTNIKSIIYFFKAIKESKKVIRDFKPDVVIGFGGYVTAPVLYAAKKLDIPTFAHEQNMVIGLSNKFLARFVDKFGVSFASTVNKFKPGQAVFTGNPLGEQAMRVKKAKSSDYFANDLPIVLLSMGSLGSATINEVVKDLIPRLNNKPYNLLWVTGTATYDKYKDLKGPDNVKIVPFIKDQAKTLRITDLFITRAGGGALAEAGVLGMPSIIIPSPYVTDNHQVMNAKDFEETGAALVISEFDLDVKTLDETIDKIMNDDKLRKDLVRKIKKTGVKNSATLIYEEIAALRKK